jgi:hypothetical protein
MQRSLWLLAIVMVCAPLPAAAQGLRDELGQLFIFGSGDEPLFLSGTADPSNPASVQVHGDHFIPAAVEGNATLISFLTNAIGTNVANLPISATSSGRTFRFEGGVPVATSTSAGPIFAERAQTMGKGRVLVGVNVSQFNFATVRGVGLDNIELNFSHENVDFPGCDSIFGGDCSLQGIPGLENDFIQLGLNIDLNVRSTLFLLSYGLLDWLDVGVAVPVVSTSLSGTSTAQVVPFGGPTAVHFFAGTPADPDLIATRSVGGSVSGLGDLAARLKIRVAESEKTAFGVLADARFPTGNEADLLGSGHLALRGLGIVSARFGSFSPHANVGYVYRTGELQNSAVLALAGFDHALADWVTLAVDVVSELQTGQSKLKAPAPTVIDTPFHRVITPTNIPDIRDDLVNGSFGFKFVTSSGVTIIANSLWPLNRGGLRPTVAWTLGLEYSF